MNKFEVNPFDRTAISDVKLLAGRDKELKQIRFLLKNASKSIDRIKSLMIIGERGVGKTSLLNLIANECQRNDIIPVRINLTQSNTSNSNDFFWYLFSQIINTIFNYGYFEGKGGNIEAAINKILYTEGLLDIANYVFRTPILQKNYLINKNTTFEFDQFIDDLKLIRSEVKESTDGKFTDKVKLLLLVDEVQNIYNNQKIIEDLRYIIQQQELGVGFAFAGDSSYKVSSWEEVFGGSHRDFEIINLNYFDDVESIMEYFSKSLEHIGWTTKEIEETLFYRFKLACRNIFQLTSGKPAWINSIASKMFERCMLGNSSVLKFDRQAQNDVKLLLESTGQLNPQKMSFIENIYGKRKKWVSKIFACELSTLGQVYFYSKFILSGENLMSETEFISLCEELINKQIIEFINEDKNDTKTLIDINNNNILHRQYNVLTDREDTMKLWLQINSDGFYAFEYASPRNKFISYINSRIVLNESNFSILYNKVRSGEKLIRLKQLINELNSGSLNIKDEPIKNISYLYKFGKRVEGAKDQQVLYAELENELNGTIYCWNVFNYDDKGKLVGFLSSTVKLDQIISVVNSYNTEHSKYNLTLGIDKIEIFDLKKLVDLIITSEDKKKISIVLDDKSNELVKKYIHDHDLESSFKTAQFFYKLFDDGFDLDIDILNNTGYVFTTKQDYSKARKLFDEGKIRIKNDEINFFEYTSAGLVLYNNSILDVYEQRFVEALEGFNNVVNFCNGRDIWEFTAEALHFVKHEEETIIIDEDIKEDTQRSIDILEKTRNNIILLTDYINKKKNE